MQDFTRDEDVFKDDNKKTKKQDIKTKLTSTWDKIQCVFSKKKAQ
jgi:hypothetical protein